jgi:hypothetical protein
MGAISLKIFTKILDIVSFFSDTSNRRAAFSKGLAVCLIRQAAHEKHAEPAIQAWAPDIVSDQKHEKQLVTTLRGFCSKSIAHSLDTVPFFDLNMPQDVFGLRAGLQQDSS